MKIPQMQPFINNKEYQGLKDCFQNNWITEGPKCEIFLNKLLDMIGAKYGVLVPNGTLGLFLALKSLGIQPDDEVLIPDFTFFATASAINLVGAKAVFVDVNLDNYQILIENLENSLTPKTKAIMPVHIYGTSVEMDLIIQFAKKYNLMVIEDAAQALGVFYRRKHTGTFGNAGVFSFYADKTITTGEGGLVVTNNYETYQTLVALRNQGRSKSGSFYHEKMGYNFKFTDLQASIGLIQLEKMPQIVENKKQISNWYKRNLKNNPNIKFFRPPEDADWIPFRFPILINDKSPLINHLLSNGIEAREFFYPLHLQPALQKLRQEIKLTNSYYLFQHGLCLPSYPALLEEEVMYICQKINELLLS